MKCRNCRAHYQRASIGALHRLCPECEIARQKANFVSVVAKCRKCGDKYNTVWRGPTDECGHCMPCENCQKMTSQGRVCFACAEAGITPAMRAAKCSQCNYPFQLLTDGRGHIIGRPTCGKCATCTECHRLHRRLPATLCGVCESRHLNHYWNERTCKNCLQKFHADCGQSETECGCARLRELKICPRCNLEYGTVICPCEPCRSCGAIHRNNFGPNPEHQCDLCARKICVKCKKTRDRTKAGSLCLKCYLCSECPRCRGKKAAHDQYCLRCRERIKANERQASVLRK